jgi:general secretion pathway protein K
MKTNRPGRSQTGVALITVMLIVSISSVLAVTMVTRQNLAIHQTMNTLDQNQAYQYALLGEEIARQLLHIDFESADKIDYLAEAWAGEFEPFEYDDGEVEIHITDLQGQFNLNSLSVRDQQAHQVSKTRFLALLSVLALDQMMLDRITDWIDEDQAPGQLGAEDYEYMVLEPPYRTASNPMVDVSELRLLLDMSEEDYQRLIPYVCVLPDPNSNINVNTAPGPVLQSLGTGLTADKAADLIDFRDYDEGFDDVNEFLRQAGVTGAGSVDSKGLSTMSYFFQVQIRARYNERTSNLISVLQRDSVTGGMQVISRDLSHKFIRQSRDQSTDVDAGV